jgi:hypothetical protein
MGNGAASCHGRPVSLTCPGQGCKGRFVISEHVAVPPGVGRGRVGGGWGVSADALAYSEHATGLATHRASAGAPVARMLRELGARASTSLADAPLVAEALVRKPELQLLNAIVRRPSLAGASAGASKATRRQRAGGFTRGSDPSRAGHVGQNAAKSRRRRHRRPSGVAHR